MADRTLTVKLVGDVANLQRSMRTASAEADKFGSKVKGGAGKGLSMLKLGAIGAGIAVGGILVKGLKGSFAAAIEAEASQAALHAQLKALGQDTPAIAGKVGDMSDKLSMLTGFDDEALTDAFSNLARNVGDSGKALNEMGLVTDIARAKNISLEQASTLVGKVMNGNTGVLKRYGISLKEGATSQEALAAMQQKFGGQAEAYGHTTAGAMARAGVAVGNLQERIGMVLAPAVAWLATKGVEYINRFGPTISRVLGQAVAWVQANWPKIRAVIEKVMTAIEPIVRNALNVVKQIVLTVSALLQGRWGEAWSHIKQAVVSELNVIKAELRLAVSVLGSIAGRIGSAILNGIKGGLSGLGRWLVGKVREAINGVIRIFNSLAIPSLSVRFDTHIPGVGVQGFSTPRIDLPNIPTLASGGIVNSPTLALIGEKGPEAVVPLGRGFGGVTIVVQGGMIGSKEQVVEWVRQGLIEHQRRNGRAIGVTA